VLLFSAWTKSNDQRTFRHDLMRYRLIPVQLIGVAVWLVTLFEWFLGAALLGSFCLQWLLPGTAFLFLCFAALTFWGEKRRSLTDCGCFAGILPITPHQSLIFDLFLAILLSFSCFFMGRMDATPRHFSILLIVLSVVVGAVLLILSRKRPVFDASRLKIGRKWKRILKQAPHSKNLEQFFPLGDSIYHCHLNSPAPLPLGNDGYGRFFCMNGYKYVSCYSKLEDALVPVSDFRSPPGI
jgi:hypothetical protein